MQTIDIVKESPLPSSFRAKSIIAQFDITQTKIIEHFKAEVDLSGDWKIGCIVGRSGTGKSTIARDLFKSDYVEPKEYTGQCVLDDMPEGVTTSQITQAFTSVGFSSAPSWLKPYAVLSQGERMRVDIAREILSERKRIVFDEFTSVVDREVAKVSSMAIAKAIRKSDKQFVAVTCHYDILEWLQPDWVLYTDDMRFEVTAGKFFRPTVELEVRQCSRQLWNLFRRYHYLNYDLSVSSHCYVALHNGEPIAFIAIKHLPHPTKKNIKTIHRLVVLPDYQGIGIGTKLLNMVASFYKKQGFAVHIVTSNPALNRTLSRSGWILVRLGRINNDAQMSSFKKTSSKTRNTATWKYKG